jgi:hypothetical protein
MTALVRKWTGFEPAARVASTRAWLVKLAIAYLNRLPPPPCCM